MDAARRHRAAFARRGMGLGAISPDRYSSDNVGVVESFVWGNDAAFSDLSLDDSVTWCDKDGFLDLFTKQHALRPVS